MSSITSLGASDNGSVSRTTINTNFTNLNTDKIETSVLDTDTTLAANSDSKIATQKATKAYVDGVAAIGSNTAGVSVGPASSSTQTVTHSLGRVPKNIHITGYGQLKGSGSSQSGGSTTGVYTTTSGNKCVYKSASTTANDNTFGTSSSFTVYLSGLTAAAAEVHATGVVQNLTSTTFDIVWTVATDCSTATAFMWECN